MAKLPATMTSHQLANEMLRNPDVPVYLSSDSEGNSIGTLSLGSPDDPAYTSLSWIVPDDEYLPTALVLYPWDEGMDLSDVGVLLD